ncbi:MAG: lipopolysaccharide biosynthesis protein RfbH [Synergistaceae bacterium]|jgi:CDP-6-deoxy-D-xylo-4-hexulose-3-dehydrase|nr:lipopolysaccharide biosynthesis protein RfbH [Synergistaceae bacterium]
MIRNSEADEMRAKILSLIPEYFQRAFDKGTFIPGKTPIPASGKVFDSDDVAGLIEASLDFWLTAGRFAEAFEEKFAERVGTSHCCLVNSGSSANLLALAALTSRTLGGRALVPGDEVITPAVGFPTTVNPIYQLGLTPVYVDVEPRTYNVSLGSLKKAISPKTKAIFMAHTLGNPFDCGGAASFAREHGLWLVEDCCDALGSEFQNRGTGTFGDLAAFSFYPAHHITTGEGGAVVTDSHELAALIQSFRDWGRHCRCAPGQDNRCGMRFSQQFGELPKGYDHKYVYSEIGYNLKMTDMQAAVGLSQLKKLDAFIEKRRENFQYLSERLQDFQDTILLPAATPGSNPSWFGFPLAIKPECGIVREDLLRFLEQRKVGTRLLFGGNLTRQPAYIGRKHRIAEELRNTDFVMNHVFWVGIYPGLTREMLDYTVSCISEFLAEQRRL